MNKANFKRITISLLSIFLSLLFVELFLFLFPHLVEDNYYKLGWNHWTDLSRADEFVENKEVYNQMYTFDERFGYVNPDVIEKISLSLNKIDIERILVLGDSVSEDGTYIKKVEQGLNESDLFPQVVLLNAGHSGYDTTMELNFLKNAGINFDPSLVILQVNPNDFDGTPVIINDRDNGWLAFDNRDNAVNINQSLFKHIKTYQLFVTMTMKSGKNKSSNLSELEKYIKVPLLEIADLLREKEIDFIIVYFPFFGEKEWAESTRNSMNNIVDSLSLESDYLDLTPYFMNYPSELVSLDDTHPNEYGDELAANAIINFIQEKGL